VPPVFPIRNPGRYSRTLRSEEVAVSEGRGFLYRFPDRDFQLGIGAHVPEVGETLRAKGRMWTVVLVTRDADGRAVVSLEPTAEPPHEPEAPFSPD
jgi:hypothetical protein